MVKAISQSEIDSRFGNERISMSVRGPFPGPITQLWYIAGGLAQGNATRAGHHGQAETQFRIKHPWLGAAYGRSDIIGAHDQEQLSRLLP